MSEHQTITLLNATAEQIQTLINLAKVLGFPPAVDDPTTGNVAMAEISQRRDSGAENERLKADGPESGPSSTAVLLNPDVHILGLQIDVNEALSAEVYQWVARIRNQGTICVVVIPVQKDNPKPDLINPAWTTQLIALGFLRKELEPRNALHKSEHPSWALYFDIHQYKEPPDWLNARHWANPQNWNKFRW